MIDGPELRNSQWKETKQKILLSIIDPHTVYNVFAMINDSQKTGTKQHQKLKSLSTMMGEKGKLLFSPCFFAFFEDSPNHILRCRFDINVERSCLSRYLRLFLNRAHLHLPLYTVKFAYTVIINYLTAD